MAEHHREKLYKAIKLLPEPQQRRLNKLLNGQTAKEIAKEEKVSTAAVSKCLAAAKAKIREYYATGAVFDDFFTPLVRKKEKPHEMTDGVYLIRL